MPFHFTEGKAEASRSSASGKPGAMLGLTGPWRWEELHSGLEGHLGIEGTLALHMALVSALSGFIFPLNREMARTTKEVVEVHSGSVGSQPSSGILHRALGLPFLGLNSSAYLLCDSRRVSSLL